jgi:hypothetical protein
LQEHASPLHLRQIGNFFSFGIKKQRLPQLFNNLSLSPPLFGEIVPHLTFFPLVVLFFEEVEGIFVK